MTPGHQFQQPGLFPAADEDYRNPLQHWDAARAAHHLGTRQMPYDPHYAASGEYTPDMPEVRRTMQPHEFQSYTPLAENEHHDRWGKPDILEHFDPRQSQTILSIHKGALQVPSVISTSGGGEFEGSHALELDHHGNVEDTRHPSYARYAPQHSPVAYDVFKEHGRDVTIHPHTPLHTAQPAWSTGTLHDIEGPVRDDSPPIPIVMKAGTPYLMDGHHRRAKAAALGQSIRGRVVNQEQFAGQPGFDERGEAVAPPRHEWQPGSTPLSRVPLGG